MGTIATTRNDRLRIVVGLDFSEMSDRAVQVAVNLARSSAGADLHLVHVIAPPVAGAELIPMTDIGETAQAARKQIGEIIESKIAGLPQVDAVTQVVVGDAQRELPRIAKETEADLIIIGTHGRRGLDRALFGSVAEHVVRYAPCSVLTVRPPIVSAADSIEPPCPDCFALAQKTGGKERRCAQHMKPRSERAHTYSELPEGFGLGSMTFRF